MGYMFKEGFLGTKAPFFMDLVTLIVALLPLLLYIAIYFAKIKKVKLHIFLQISIYIITLIVVGYFEYGIRVGGGFETFKSGTLVNDSYLKIVLIMHILVAVLAFILWSKTVIVVTINYLKGTLNFSKHKKSAQFVYFLITLTALTGIWVYILLFL